MSSSYHPAEIESKWYPIWEQHNYFSPKGNGQAYAIMIPPPNVTGSLHMGHAFQHTLMDVLIRYQRMNGKKTLWQVGTDHAGISTQMVVERQLEQQGQTRYDLGRDQFIDQVWKWKEQSGSTITMQMRRLGISVDWSRERFTMDEGLSSAVREVFISLYQEGLVYRGLKLVNWDPTFRTAISDLEVNSVEEQGSLWHIRYPISGSNTFLVVATTRPETLLGDVAVAVHPEDERYQHLIGQMLELPLCQRQIPVIADEAVEREFGTGCVKITPAHDFNDYEMGQRHQLPLINIFTDDAKINLNAPSAYQGLDRFVARKKIVADLEALGLIEKIEPHMLKVPRADRGNTVVEPYLTQQWFVRAKPLAEAAIQAVEQGEIRFVPENWSKTYFQWLENIQDWCISRQIWWGHRIPAWYDEAGHCYVGHSEAEIRQQHQLSDAIILKQDEDVLDTWFSSALWPFSTLGWPEKTAELNEFYPTSVLVTGFDIIFFWVARMVMMGLKFTGKVPFRDVYITGLIRDGEGQKMSKTKGNVLDPLDLIDGIDIDSLVAKRTQGLMQPQMRARIEKNTRKEFPQGIPASGTDALRFTLCALATTGRDIRFDLQRLEGYRNFCNKIWNASRYVFMNLGESQVVKPCKATHPVNRYIQSMLFTTIKQSHQHLQDYRFDLLAQTLYDFTWNIFCDWYLELSKPLLIPQQFSESIRAETQYILISTLETLLRLLHPLMPFITEELWQQTLAYLPQAQSSIMLSPYPTAQVVEHDELALEQLEQLQAVITTIRTIRSETNISPAKKISLMMVNGKAEQKRLIQEFTLFIQALARVEKVDWLDKSAVPAHSATGICGELEIYIPLEGLIDPEIEIKRLMKELEKTSQDHQKISQKLDNPGFIAKAPSELVQQEREKIIELELLKNKLLEKLHAFGINEN